MKFVKILKNLWVIKMSKTFQIYGFPKVDLNDKEVGFCVNICFENCSCELNDSIKYFSVNKTDSGIFYSKYIELDDYAEVKEMIFFIKEFIDDNMNKVDSFIVINYLQFVLDMYFFFQNKNKFMIKKGFVFEIFDKYLPYQTKRNKCIFVESNFKNIDKIGYKKIFYEVMNYEMRFEGQFFPSWFETMKNICSVTDCKIDNLIIMKAKEVLNKDAFEVFKKNIKNLDVSTNCHILRRGNDIKRQLNEFEKELKKIEKEYLKYQTLFDIADKL